LRTASGLLNPLLLLFSIFLLLTGHNAPGGGFIGGLVASAAFGLFIFSHGVEAARSTLGVAPRRLAAAGLLVALASGLLGLALGRPFMAPVWGTLVLPGFGATKVGTPLLFDLGVYLVVVGVVLEIAFALAEEE
jgi:multicomponent Na+:H+ antiporter subunit B